MKSFRPSLLSCALSSTVLGVSSGCKDTLNENIFLNDTIASMRAGVGLVTDFLEMAPPLNDEYGVALAGDNGDLIGYVEGIPDELS